MGPDKGTRQLLIASEGSDRLDLDLGTQSISSILSVSIFINIDSLLVVSCGITFGSKMLNKKRIRIF